MRVKEWVDCGLTVDREIEEGIDDASKEGRYVEDFTILHEPLATSSEPIMYRCKSAKRLQAVDMTIRNMVAMRMNLFSLAKSKRESCLAPLRI